MEKYSVLMSVYKKDNPLYFSQSIESMVNQTVRCDQFVIVKDGPISSDLEKVINDFCDKYPDLFTIVSLKDNGGLGHALNEGIKVCRNELIARMDSDDISLPNRCEKQLCCFDNMKELSIVGTYINEFYDNPSHIVSSRQVPVEHEEIVKFARRRSPFNHPTVMYKKSAVINSGGYPELSRKEDLRLFPVMVNRGYIAHNIPEALLLYRSNEDNYKRRKTWVNCKEYISVIHQNYKDGYCSLNDLLYVTLGQSIMFLTPMKVTKLLSDNILRKKPLR